MKVPGRGTRLMQPRWGSDRGGAMVELAVIFPILLLIIIGVVDYGRVFFTAVTVANAARAGAEYGAHDPAFQTDFVGMKDYAQQDGQEAGPLVLSAQRYCECALVSWPSCGACSGGAAPDVFVEVTASKNLTLLLKYPGLPAAVSIVRKATFRVQ